MDLDTLKKQLQQHLADGLVMVVGSGLSCAEGVPGMGALGHHLSTQLPATLSPGDGDLWAEIHPEIAEVGLEAALLKNAPTPSLEAAIVQSTADFIASAESAIIADVFSDSRTLRLTRLIPHILRPDTGIPIITTNYDRLIEIACEEAGLGVDTMFSGQFAAKLDPSESRWSFCRGVKLAGRSARYRFASRANVYKPHGSLDWYYREGEPVRYAGALPLPRLIITPGLNKYRNGYESPFDKHRERANDAIDRAKRFLIIGYGFNDDHLETHLTPRIRAGTPTVLLTYALSDKAKNLAYENNNLTAISCDSDGNPDISHVIAGCNDFEFPLNIWDLGNFVEKVLEQ